MARRLGESRDELRRVARLILLGSGLAQDLPRAGGALAAGPAKSQVSTQMGEPGGTPIGRLPDLAVCDAMADADVQGLVLDQTGYEEQ